MTINREKLVSLIVERSGIDQLDVESQLDELTSKIMDAANRGKALEIKGFGLFFFDENDELTFRASDQLDAEINFNHAGMEPVELDSPKSASTTASEVQPGKDDDEPSTGVSDTDEADDVFGIGKTLSAQLGDDDSNDSGPFGKLFQEESNPVEPEPQSEKEVKKAGTATGKKSPKSDTPKKSPPKKKSRDPINTIIAVVMAAVFLFVGYLVFTEFINAPEQTSETQQQVTEIENPPAEAEQDVTEAVEPEVPETVEVPETDSDPEPVEQPTDEETETEPYGLYGELSEAEGDLFTIVVHSLRDRGVAERTAGELREDGYRTSINQRVVNERTVFRVGIGQFATIREAQQEAETLPEPFNNQNFIQRIQ